MSNVATVQSIYEAFGRGDVPTILDKMSDGVQWEYGYKDAPNPVPWLQYKEGKTGVGEFFQSLSATDFHKFVPNAILEGLNLVVALVDIEFTVKETGKRVTEHNEAHVWHFDDAGKVVGFRHCADTYSHVMAYQKQTAGTTA